jgi:Protein of unknown function (DUF3309)
VLVLGVTILLAVVSVAAFPCWSYSARWGYAPSVIAGGLLFCVAMIVVSGKSAPKAAEPDIAAVVVPAPTPGTHASRHNVETVIVERETASP